MCVLATYGKVDVTLHDDAFGVQIVKLIGKPLRIFVKPNFYPRPRRKNSRNDLNIRRSLISPILLPLRND